MENIFSKIVSGTVPCHRIAETENYLAFLDIFPIAKGHTLVIPKKEVNYIFNLEDNLLGGLHIFAKRIGLAIEKRVQCARVGLTVVGLEIPHAHIHLIPINGVHDIDFSRPKLQFSEEEFSKLAADIASEVI